MAEYQIYCITKPHKDSPREAITNIGFLDPQAPGGKQYNPVSAIIAFVASGVHKYYVEDKNKERAYVIVAKSSNGNLFIKTQPDDTKEDNLLSLPSCGKILNDLIPVSSGKTVNELRKGTILQD